MEHDFEKFFKANERRIHYQIHRLGISGEWYEEFYTEGIYGLWLGFKRFDPEKAELGTFLNYQIRYRLLDLLRKKTRQLEADKEAKQAKIVKLTSGNRHRASGRPVVSDSGIPLADGAFWREVRSRLSERQWKWVEYFIIAELSVKEIMELEGVSADAVKNWGRQVRRKLRDDELRKKLEKLL